MSRVPFWAILLCATLLAGSLPAAASAPAIPIASEPLYSGRANVHPNLLLSLSVEFPTVGIAYRADGGNYLRAKKYTGYFNPAKCYVYQGGNRNLGDKAWFRIHKNADPDTHECGGDSFSGNFMNWAASSAIDMLRLALTGGDRVIDEPGITVLQRAVLRDDAGGNFYASDTYFPRRTVVAGDGGSAPGQVTPFDVSTLYVASCRNRILFSDIKSDVAGGSAKARDYCLSAYNGKGSPPDQARDKKLGEYLVRVLVCDKKEGPERSDLCHKYGSHYKPVGELQRHAARVRVGAMGYLLDDTPQRYGGVLRAPLKYVGERRFLAPGFVAIANDRPEWDAQTGVFHSNPDDPKNRNDAGKNSGVINYLNKFGRHARYKTYDPVSELYYEGLRYLQGKQPTPEATAGMTEAMRDGFPVLEKWEDPVIASCQRNHMLVIGDVNTHWDRYVPGNTRTTYGANTNAHDPARPVEPEVPGKTPALDVKEWTRKVGELEADANGVHGNPAPNAALANLDAIDTGSAGHGSYYMAGLAYWANTNELRHDKPVRVQTFAIDVDEGGNGRIDGNTRTLKPRDSQLYLAAKYGGFKDRNGNGNPFGTLDTDGKTVLKGSKWDNGTGVPANYFLAGQPEEMIGAIRRIFSDVGSDSGTLSGVGLAPGQVSAGGVHVYQPGFDPAHWSGSLRKFALHLNEAQELRVGSSPAWDAGLILSGTSTRAPSPPADQRKIYTAIAGSAGVHTVELRWSELSLAQQHALGRSPVTGKQDGLGPSRLDYLRGERSRELGRTNGVFRARERVLGDIVNSNPLYVGAPAAFAYGDTYEAFFGKHKDRAPAVYVGANDGMLHAFDAESGEELFAYVPQTLIPALPPLSNPAYVHRPYVDGGLAAAEAWTGTAWKTVLVGAFGGGAQGVFALDISDPENFAGGQGALFEFTDADDPDIGNVIGRPAIARFHVGTESGAPQYRDFAVVASGLNNYVADGAGRHNRDAAGALFLIALDKPQGEAWKSGRNYYKLRLPAADKLAANGLAQPSLLTGADGVVHQAYVGDLQGQLWTIDFRSAPPWSTKAVRLLFAARDKTGKPQPITMAPRAVFAPGGGYLVLFGTGKFIEHADVAPGNFAPQSFYAIHDTGTAVPGRDALQRRTAEQVEGDAYRISGHPVSYGSAGHKGWFFDFPDSDKSGERAVTGAVVRNGAVFFNTLIPGGDPCAPGGGRSYVLSTLTGYSSGPATGFISQVGMLSAPLVLDTGATSSPRNAIGVRVVKSRHGVVNFGTGGPKGMVSPPEDGNGGSGVTTLRAGRFSWREILNWQELRDAWSKK